MTRMHGKDDAHEQEAREHQSRRVHPYPLPTKRVTTAKHRLSFHIRLTWPETFEKPLNTSQK